MLTLDKRDAWCVDYTDVTGKRHRSQFGTRKAAEKFRVKIGGQLADGTYRPDADKVTVKEVCESFLDECEGRMNRNERMTQKNFVTYRGHINNHTLHPEYGIGRHTLAQLRPKTVKGFRNRIRDAGWWSLQLKRYS